MTLHTTRSHHLPAHAKKRHAGHHTQGKHYLKTYWPYLPMLVVGGVGLVILGAVMVGPFGAIMGGVSVAIVGLVFSL